MLIAAQYSLKGRGDPGTRVRSYWALAKSGISQSVQEAVSGLGHQGPAIFPHAADGLRDPGGIPANRSSYSGVRRWRTRQFDHRLVNELLGSLFVEAICRSRSR